MLEACLILVLHHRLDFEGGRRGDGRVVDSTRSRAGRQHRYTGVYCPDLQVHARSLSSWPGWAAVRVKHF